MESSLLRNIKSNYILQETISYIRNKKLILKLFAHSKFFQDKLDIKLLDYQKECFKEILFEKYLCFNTIYDKNQEFDKNGIKNKFIEDLKQKKIDSKNVINSKEYLIYYFKKYYDSNNEEEIDSYKNNKILIDIYSPFFDEFFKKEIFNEIFKVNILPRYIINKYNLKNDYINFFENKNISSLSIYYGKKEDFNVIDELKINNNIIKNLVVYILHPDENFHFSINYKVINLNSLKIINIDSKFSKFKIDDKSFESLNNLKSLEELGLNNLIFQHPFEIKLYNLKKLFISNCENIAFCEEKSFNIEILELSNIHLSEPKKLLMFPKLKTYFVNNARTHTFFIESIFDIIKFSNYLNATMSEIGTINNSSSIEYLKIHNTSDDKEENKIMLKKINEMNSLRYIDITLSNINEEDISKIPGENLSIKKAKISWESEADCILYNLQNNYPELTNLRIDIKNIYQLTNHKYNYSIEIKENPKCKINKISINSLFGNSIKFYIQSYENLISVSFYFNTCYNISHNNFPIFNDNCKIIFKSLKYFSFVAKNCMRTHFGILTNIYENIGCMPNLKNFKLMCNHRDITESVLVKFIKKVLQTRYRNIELFLTNEKIITEYHYADYSLNELKKICPEFDINHFNHIRIKKIKNIINKDLKIPKFYD